MHTISADDWRRIEQVLDAALMLPAPARSTFIGEACGGDATLAAQVEALLALGEQPSVLDSTAAAYASPLVDAAGPLSDETADPAPAAGDVIGPYRVIRELGRGGMGTVYLAARVGDALETQIALKLLGSGVKSHELRQRFLAEQEILLRLDHTHIARLLDRGLTDDGQPWFAMEYIDGVSITEHCDARRLSVNDRLRLFRGVCEAVHYAHENFVVHRDLKPSNILVTSDGVVKLLDFGIAKFLADDPLLPNKLSRAGQRLMTPEYAAPEQVRGHAVTPATDVYSLGAVLYELVSGRRAHRLERRVPTEFVRVVCDVEPEPPSVAVMRPPPKKLPSGGTWQSPADVAEQRGTTEERLSRELARDLDSVILQALAKDPARRSASAAALGDAIAGSVTRAEAE